MRINDRIFQSNQFMHIILSQLFNFCKFFFKNFWWGILLSKTWGIHLSAIDMTLEIDKHRPGGYTHPGKWILARDSLA